MKTVTQLDNLPSLGSTLQEKLCAAFPEIVYFQVNCALDGGMLMVQIEHPEDSIPRQESLLRVVEEALADLDIDSPLPVNLYVKMPEAEHPYGLYSFTLAPLSKRSSLKGKVQNFSATPTKVPSDRVDRDLLDDREGGKSIEENLAESSKSAEHRLNLKPLAIALGAIVGLGAFAATVYALTRPCVVGGCQAITIAEGLQQQSNQQQADSQSEADIAKAKEPLATAIARLETIPTWSGSYDRAQSLKSTYQTQVNWLESMRAGLKQNEQANNITQKKPLNVAQWREAQKLWQLSLDNLQQVPADSSAYSLAQAKLKQSRNNLVTAKNQIDIAQKAENILAKAEEKARVAKALQGIAQTVPDWQKARLAWQGAIAELEKVETGTAARKSAEKALADANKQLKVTSDRQTQESISATNYNSSQKLAQNAQDFQIADQWSQAVNNWDRAIDAARQVPRNTFYYAKVQPLIGKYQEALTQARNQLALANQRRDRARQDVQKLCSTKPPNCSFKLAEDTIKVTLSPAHTQAVKQASPNARKKGDYNAQALGETLNAISNDSRLRLELYGDDDKIIQVHNPGR